MGGRFEPMEGLTRGPGMYKGPETGERDVAQRMVGIVHLADGESTGLVVLHSKPALESLELPRVTGDGASSPDEPAPQWTPVFHDVYRPAKIYRHEMTRDIVAISYVWVGTRLKMVTRQDSPPRPPWLGVGADHDGQTDKASESDAEG